MPRLPDEVLGAIAECKDAGVLTTVDGRGVPNGAYVGLMRLIDCEKLVFSDGHLGKTRANILAGSLGAYLFIVPARHKSYQVKGHIEYFTDGPIFDDIAALVSPEHPTKAVVVLNVEEVYCGADRLV